MTFTSRDRDKVVIAILLVTVIVSLILLICAGPEALLSETTCETIRAKGYIDYPASKEAIAIAKKCMKN
jgi:hypothetical protein